ncbi:MAG: tRNA (adenosine(37)-N6)-threonylcarbamoyltransferase complex ATPase subunit type 1 TsaE [Candidatus Omnitrophota bacterium]
MRIISNNLTQTKNLGKKIASLLKEGDFIALYGDLGSGKTTLAQSIIKSLGVKEGYIISPTFVLIREYEGKLKIYHFDLYRLNYLEELLELGYEDYFYRPKGVTLVEWAQKIEELLPREYLKIELFNRTETTRKIKITAYGKDLKERLKVLEKKIKK